MSDRVKWMLAFVLAGAACAPAGEEVTNAGRAGALAAPTTEAAAQTPAAGEAEPVDQDVAADGPNYSPFAVKIRHESVDIISFKDVGIAPSDAWSGTYEELAESVAEHANLVSEDQWMAEVAHDPSLAEPDAHLACGGRHIYVDVWTSEAPHRWGYSLWSGCGAESQFGWEEIATMPTDDDGVERVGEAIARALWSASETGCYTASC